MFKEKRKLNKVEKAVVWIAIFFAFCFFVQISSVAASEITSQNVIQLVNKERLSQGISALLENEILDKAAADKLNDMISNDYFAHTSPKGTLPWYWFEKNGYDYKYAGENLAVNFSSAKDQHKAWMASSTHRKNILNPLYREIGVAVAKGKIDGGSTIMTVQLFGTRVAALFSSKENRPAEATEKTIEVKQAENAQGENISGETPLAFNPVPPIQLDSLQPEKINVAKPVCQNDLCYFSEANSFFDEGGNSSERIAWATVILILVFSVVLNTLTLSHHENQNPFVAANTVVLLLVLTSMVLWKI